MAETMHIRMTRQYTHKIDAVETRTFPQGWTGWIAAKLASDLIKKGIATAMGKPVDDAEAAAVSEVRADLEAIISKKNSEIATLQTAAQTATTQGDAAAAKLKDLEADKKVLTKQVKDQTKAAEDQTQMISNLQAALAKADDEIRELKASAGAGE